MIKNYLIAAIMVSFVHCSQQNYRFLNEHRRKAFLSARKKISKHSLYVEVRTKTPRFDIVLISEFGPGNKLVATRSIIIRK